MKKRRWLAGIAAAVLLSAAEASAQLQWDTNTTTAGAQGGTGNWVSTNFWNNGTNNIPWVDGSVASFGGAAGTVSVNGFVTANGLNFLTNGYVIDGTSPLTLGGAATISIPAAGTTATISAPLDGVVGLTKTGSGTLVLNGINIFSGLLNINGGTIKVSEVAGREIT